ncbi:VOC family protein [Saccharopolyspora erythraea]|uniref:VOC family protein n=1 Tax=Saccharopolyspora erythraea TaxID=1836 RepID=UPI001BACCD81|nr:VOC family protein [Saccharopolyspora erythraea]QUH04425.1 VOC family protein [Saccharopolyspora erythraea]
MKLDIVMVTFDCTDPQGLAEFWTRALDMTVAFDAGEFMMLSPKSGNGPALGLQRVPEPRTGKNRVHIDLSTDDPAAEVRRLVELGARELGGYEAPGIRWRVLADPEGNEFCVGVHE